MLIVSLLLCAVLLSACGKSEAGGTAETTVVETVENCSAVIEIENYGSITLELDGSAAPITVANFVALAESDFYDTMVILHKQAQNLIW